MIILALLLLLILSIVAYLVYKHLAAAAKKTKSTLRAILPTVKSVQNITNTILSQDNISIVQANVPIIKDITNSIISVDPSNNVFANILEQKLNLNTKTITNKILPIQINITKCSPGNILKNNICYPSTIIIPSTNFKTNINPSIKTDTMFINIKNQIPNVLNNIISLIQRDVNNLDNLDAILKKNTSIMINVLNNILNDPTALQDLALALNYIYDIQLQINNKRTTNEIITQDLYKSFIDLIIYNLMGNKTQEEMYKYTMNNPHIVNFILFIFYQIRDIVYVISLNKGSMPKLIKNLFDIPFINTQFKFILDQINAGTIPIENRYAKLKEGSCKNNTNCISNQCINNICAKSNTEYDIIKNINNNININVYPSSIKTNITKNTTLANIQANIPTTINKIIEFIDQFNQIDDIIKNYLEIIIKDLRILIASDDFKNELAYTLYYLINMMSNISGEVPYISNNIFNKLINYINKQNTKLDDPEIINFILIILYQIRRITNTIQSSQLSVPIALINIARLPIIKMILDNIIRILPSLPAKDIYFKYQTGKCKYNFECESNKCLNNNCEASNLIQNYELDNLSSLVMKTNAYSYT